MTTEDPESRNAEQTGELGDTKVAALIKARETELLRQLTSGVAHEVRNPLNGILSLMGALSKEFPDNEQFQPYMQQIRKLVTRLNGFMEELVLLGRPLREENMCTISMVTLIESALSTWKQTLQEEPSVRIVKQVRTEDHCIRADAFNIQQAIIHLLDNAFMNSPAGAEIVCSVNHQAATDAILSIRDAGPGIPEDILPKIFDPFFIRRKGETGLRLSIARHLIEINGGRVIAFNNLDGPGATFEVRLPLFPQA
jgi:signal transduction histidine kinase